MTKYRVILEIVDEHGEVTGTTEDIVDAQDFATLDDETDLLIEKWKQELPEFTFRELLTTQVR